MALQREAGNAAVTALVQRQLVQRQGGGRKRRRKQPTGIGARKPTGRFAAAAKKVHARWAKLTPAQRAAALVKAANEELDAIGVPTVQHTLEDLGESTAGQFDAQVWALELGQSDFTRKKLSRSAFADLAGTVYHETRHAEQDFRIARYLASVRWGYPQLEGVPPPMSAAEIVSELSIPPRVAGAAVKDPLPAAAEAERKEASAWYESQHGSKSDERAKTHDALEKAEEALVKARERYEKLQKDPKATARQKASARAGRKRAYRKYLRAWRRYETLPEEADAFKVEKRLRRALRRK